MTDLLHRSHSIQAQIDVRDDALLHPDRLVDHIATTVGEVQHRLVRQLLGMIRARVPLVDDLVI